jgi:hypothetical protein
LRIVTTNSPDTRRVTLRRASICHDRPFAGSWVQGVDRGKSIGARDQRLLSGRLDRVDHRGYSVVSEQDGVVVDAQHISGRDRR